MEYGAMGPSFAVLAFLVVLYIVDEEVVQKSR